MPSEVTNHDTRGPHKANVSISTPSLRWLPESMQHLTEVWTYLALGKFWLERTAESLTLSLRWENDSKGTSYSGGQAACPCKQRQQCSSPRQKALLTASKDSQRSVRLPWELVLGHAQEMTLRGGPTLCQRSDYKEEALQFRGPLHSFFSFQNPLLLPLGPSKTVKNSPQLQSVPYDHAHLSSELNHCFHPHMAS